ncbi:glycoside hydrolase family 95-like protein [Streptomyces sp. NPDC002577]
MVLPALPEQWDKGTITGIRGRGGIRVHGLAWDLSDGTTTVTVTSDRTQDVTLISRRGITAVTTSAQVGPSMLGPRARNISLAAGQRTRITISLPTDTSAQAHRRPEQSGHGQGG